MLPAPPLLPCISGPAAKGQRFGPGVNWSAGAAVPACVWAIRPSVQPAGCSCCGCTQLAPAAALLPAICCQDAEQSTPWSAAAQNTHVCCLAPISTAVASYSNRQLNRPNPVAGWQPSVALHFCTAVGHLHVLGEPYPAVALTHPPHSPTPLTHSPHSLTPLTHSFPQ